MVEQIFPKVNFDWLGELPSLMREAQGYKELRDMGPPKTDSVKNLEEAASKYFALGTKEGERIGTILLQQAGVRRGIEQRGAEFAAEQANRPAMLKALEGFMGSKSGGAAAAPAESGIVATPPAVPEEPTPGKGSALPTPNTSAALSAEPDATKAALTQLAGSVTPLPIQPGPQAGMPNAAERIQGMGNPAVPMINPQTPQGFDNLNRQYNAMPPGPRGAEVRPTPSEEMLVAAEGAPKAPAAPPVQLAQGPAQTAVPGAAPPGAAPPPMQPNPVTPQLPNFGQSSPERIQNMWKFLVESGRRPTPITKQVEAMLSNEMRQANLNPEERRYIVDYYQSAQRGEKPPGTFQQWRNEQKDFEPRMAEVRKIYDPIFERGQQAEMRKDSLIAMKAMTEDPRFNGAFEGTDLWDRGVGVLRGVATAIRNSGGPDFTDKIAKVYDSTTYRQVFDALSKQIVAQSQPKGLGGQSFSSTDRDYMDKTVPNISQTPEGRKLLIDIQMAKAERESEALRIADEARIKKGDRVSVTDISTALREYAKEHPIFKDSKGNYTDLGNRVQNNLKQRMSDSAKAARAEQERQATERQKIQELQQKFLGYGFSGAGGVQ
jgi:hypothetical protein